MTSTSYVNFGVPGLVVTAKYFLLFVLGILIEQHTKFATNWDYALNYDQVVVSQTNIFDFIVVGGGSAGAVVASRLSAPPNNYKVLLLEAGGDQNPLTYYPQLDVFCTNHRGVDWMYKSVPEEFSCQSSINKQTALNRGLGLGGSSILNYLVYNRGNRRDFDNWAEITGDQSWNYENVLPYFIKSENYNGHFPNEKLHGCGGLLNVDKGGYHEGREFFLAALKEHGIFERDISENQTNTFMRMEQTSKGGIRWSTYLGFLKPFIDRVNLFIFRYSFVTKLLFSKDDPTRVIGVEYIRHNVTTHVAYARKEVILSAGAYNSPKILMLSGIGPTEELLKHWIPVRKDLPVGKKLEDHPTTVVPFIFNTSKTSFLFERDVFWDLFGSTRKGSLGSNSILATGYTSSPANDDPNWPDTQYHTTYLGLSDVVSSLVALLINAEQSMVKQFFDPVADHDGNVVLISGVRPKSRGYVTLASANPHDPPKILSNFLQHPDDVTSLVHGIKFLINFYENSKAYQKIGAQFSPVPWPACTHVPFRSDEYLECYVRHVTFSIWHPVSTCPMGKADDPWAVVDPRLKVHGFQGLRVIDASVMPKVTNGNTNAPTIMIGEKGAAMIIEDWGGVNAPTGGQIPCENFFNDEVFNP